MVGMKKLLVSAARVGSRIRTLQAVKHSSSSLCALHSQVGNSTNCLLKCLNEPGTSAPASLVIPSLRGLCTASTVDDESHLKPEEESGRKDEHELSKKKKPLFTKATSISRLTKEDICSYITISEEDWARSIGEGLPAGLTKEYEDSKGSSLLVRASFLDLRDELKSCAEKAHLPDAQAMKPRKQFMLDGPVSSGKSITLAMLVHWARSEGWFVFYVPNGREWTHGGFFYRNPHTSLWDTPVQAATVLQRLLKSHENLLQKLPCRIFEPITLGEGVGVGIMKEAEAVAMPEGSTLYDLIQTGLTYSQAAVGVVVRLREELSLVKEVPVLFVIDQYNSWFTFSQYQEVVTWRSCQPIHARELSMVKAYRSMLHNDMMVTAFSHSTAVGKLRKHLPDVPLNARIDFPRYSFDEAAAVCAYYLRQDIIKPERYSEDKWKRVYYLANGNGSEIRNLSFLI